MLTPSLSPSPTPTNFACPSAPLNATADSLVDVVLALITSEHAQLVMQGSERQCSLEAAMAIQFEQGLQLVGGSKRRRRRRRRQMADSGNYTAEVRGMLT